MWFYNSFWQLGIFKVLYHITFVFFPHHMHFHDSFYYTLRWLDLRPKFGTCNGKSANLNFKSWFWIYISVNTIIMEQQWLSQIVHMNVHFSVLVQYNTFLIFQLLQLHWVWSVLPLIREWRSFCLYCMYNSIYMHEVTKIGQFFMPTNWSRYDSSMMIHFIMMPWRESCQNVIFRCN